jgi:hypothetical protein
MLLEVMVFLELKRIVYVNVASNVSQLETTSISTGLRDQLPLVLRLCQEDWYEAVFILFKHLAFSAPI